MSGWIHFLIVWNVALTVSLVTFIYGFRTLVRRLKKIPVVCAAIDGADFSSAPDNRRPGGGYQPQRDPTAPPNPPPSGGSAGRKG